MRRSASFVLPNTCSHQASTSVPEDNSGGNCVRHVYINTEEAQKEKHTIFHSPYKGGRKNPSYTNPSFMSSDIFYPGSSLLNEHSKSKPKVGLVGNRNGAECDNKFKSRTLNKSMSGACLNRDRSAKRLNVERGTEV